MILDLRGQWARDAEISLTQSMGGGVLHLPRDVAIEGLSVARSTQPVDVEAKPPTLRFTASSSMGELEIIE
jgi:hypothetical protein